jgi:ATP-dependent protease HslVU (ClpYQ) peptidase subunit
MTTVVVVRKGNTVAIAADSLVTFGDTRLAHGYEANQKLFRCGNSWIGMAGTTAHFPVLRKALSALPAEDLKLQSRDEVFDTFLKLHPKLKETYFLNTKPTRMRVRSSLHSSPTRRASTPSTRTAKCSSSTASGASALGADSP